MHIHTKYSKDGFIRLEKLRKICAKKNIVPIITDHNTIKGALEYKSKIIAEEIKTKEGDIIGLFLNNEIPKELSVEETIDKIKEQDGLVYFPHPGRPFDGIKNFRKNVDIIEVFNARNFLKRWNDNALKLADDNNLLKGAGSDAHLACEVGKAYVQMEDFNDKQEFVKNLRNAKIIGERSCLLVHLPTITLNRF